MSLRSYAGIGSRDTPPDILEAMSNLAGHLAGRSWILRSGAAHGADAAFEKGCAELNGRREIYLPWPSYNGHHSRFEPKLEAYRIAAEYHPKWHMLKPGARKLMARNVHIILGVALRDPVSFVICWTPNGAVTGGTGQALRMALHMDIPIINLGSLSLEEAETQILSLIE